LLKNWDSVIDTLVDNSLDVLMVTESWLRPGDDKDGQLNCLPAGYTILHVPRPRSKGKRGGGVAIIFRECLTVQSFEPITATSFEGMEVVMTINSSCVRFVLIYRPPPSPQNGYTVSQFIAEFSDLLESQIASAGKILIGGDFNFHWDDLNNPDTVLIKNVITSFNLTQHVSGATHTSLHTLDWILTRDTENILTSTDVSSLITDHHLLKCTLKLARPPLPREVRTYRSYKSLDYAQLLTDIQSSDLIQNPNDSLCGLVEQYNNTLSNLLDKHAPLKTKVITIRPITPWYSDEIHAAKAERRKCEARWRESGLTVHRQIYKEARNKVTSLIKSAKISFFTDRVEGCGKDQKALFSVVNEILGRKKERKLPPHSSLKDILNSFSSFFHTKISSIRQKLDTEVTDTLLTYLSVLPVEDPVPGSKLTTLNELCMDDIRKLVMKSPSKSCMLDPLPTWLLKKLLEPLLPALTDIVNKSIESSIFPPSLKNARVTPLLKKTSLDAAIFKNYRPVSNLPFLSKILEKAVLKQMVTHMDENNLFCPIQSAYRSNHSTETALLKIQNDILLALDSGKGVILVLLDLSAAFDTIDHHILLSRLKSRVGVDGPALQWVSSYLEDRYQAVSIDGECSDSVLLIYGVPQGSVMGPLDFIAYLGPTFDIAQRHGVCMHQYADDTQLYLSFDLDKQKEALAQMEACINDIRQWMRQNKLKLNEDKSELLILTSPRLAHKVSINSIRIGDSVVHASSEAKNLGATFDHTLCHTQHVTSLVKSCNFQLRSIGQARKYLTQDATEKVMHAFVSSRLDCGNSLLYGLPECQLQRIQKLQNTAARILTRTRKFNHITPVLQSLHWLPVTERIDFKILCLTYKCLHDQAPQYLQELIEIYKPSRDLRSGNKGLLRVPDTHMKRYGDRSFAKAAPTLWNALPLGLRERDSFESFRSALKTYFFKKS
jgi:hypothetical protein